MQEIKNGIDRTHLIYGIMRLDIVLIIGQTFGSIAYMRNLWIGHNNMVMNDEKL